MSDFGVQPERPSAAGCTEWVVPSHWQAIDVLSDVHLHPDMPLTLAAWKHHLLTTPADAVLMLGDLFEVWVGDDARHLGFEAECTAVMRQASCQRTLAFLPGNRDFLLGPALCEDAGLRALPDPTVLCAFGRRWLLSHGDALCLADTEYMRFRAEVRSPAWQRRFLSQPLSVRQGQARAMRDASAQRQAGMAANDWADVDADAAAHWLVETRTQSLIHGHTHRPDSHRLPGGGMRHVLGDWDFDHPPRRASILRLSPHGLQRMDVAAPDTPPHHTA